MPSLHYDLVKFMKGQYQMHIKRFYIVCKVTIMSPNELYMIVYSDERFDFGW